MNEIDAGQTDSRLLSIDQVAENLRNDETFKQMMADINSQVEEMQKRVDDMEKSTH